MTGHESLQETLQPFFDAGLELWLDAGALRFKGPKELLNKELMGLLKANKEQIIEWLKQQEGAETAPVAPQIIDEFPLAYTQGAIWMLYKFAPNSPAYNTTFACILDDAINEEAITKAFRALLIRHPMLRTTFYDSDAGPRQQMWDRIDPPLAIVDGSDWDQAQLQTYLEQEADAPFELSKEPCLRVKVIRNSVQGTVLIATIHHVGADLWALLVVAEDIRDFYKQALSGEALAVKPVPGTYRQHVEWQQQFMDSPAGKAQRRYWQQHLQGAPTQVSLPLDFPRPPVLLLQAKVHQHTLNAELHGQIKALCKANSITPFVFLQGLFQLLTYEFTQEQDFLIGTPTMGRSRRGMEKVVGDFANPVVLRASVNPDQSLVSFFQQSRNELLSAMEFQECPFPVVVQDCSPPRDSSRTPLFQLMFVWHQGNTDLFPKDGFIKSVMPMSGPRGAPYDVMLAVADLGDSYELSWTYQTSLYQLTRIQQFCQVFCELVERALQTAWDQPLSTLFQQQTTATFIAPEKFDATVGDWLQKTGFDVQRGSSAESEQQLQLTNDQGHAVAPGLPGQLQWINQASAIETPILARLQGTELKALGLKPGWGVHNQALVDWQQDLPIIIKPSPELDALANELTPNSYWVLTQITADSAVSQGWVQRLFLLAKTPLTQPQLQLLSTYFTDVVELAEWPLTAAGEIDFAALRKMPWLNRSELVQKLKPMGLADDQFYAWRQRERLATFQLSSGEQTKTSHSGSSNQSLEEILQQRPDAWMRTGALEQALPSDNLFVALCQTAERFPNRGMLFTDADGSERTYAYPKLLADAKRAAQALTQLDLTDETILLLQMQFDERFFALWWGAVASGIRPLVVATPEKYDAKNGVAQKLYNVAHNYEGLVVAADQSRVAATREWLGASKQVFDVDALLASVSDQAADSNFPLPVVNANGVAFLQLTSGSTGTPKAIQIRHLGILHHIMASASYNEYRDDNVSMNWLPFDHVVPILTTHLKDVVLGIQQIQLPTASVLLDPLLWVRTLAKYRVTHSWAPNFAFQRVVEAMHANPELGALDLSSVQYLMNAGEQVLGSSVRAFSGALKPYGLRDNAVQPAFGMAEACTCMTYNNGSTTGLTVSLRHLPGGEAVEVMAAGEGTHEFVDLGGVVPGVEVRITDKDNQLVKEGVIGRMQIRGPVITPGYLNNPDANAEAFVGDDWFNSGDMGFIWQGHLILTGREKEMIVVNGVNYYCFEIEQMVGDLTGVTPTFVAATGVRVGADEGAEHLVLFYVPDNSVELDIVERQIMAQVSESFGVNVHAVLPIDDPANFYKTTSGKIQRSQFKKLFESDFYQAELLAFNARHQQQVQQVDTLFEPKWYPVPSQRLPVAKVFASHDQAGIQQFIQHPQAGALVVDLAVATGEHPDAWQANSLELVQQLAALGEWLTQAAFQQPVVLRLSGVQRDFAWTIKPMVETLRQETGLESIRCLLSPVAFAEENGLPMALAGHDLMSWYENGQSWGLQLCNLKPQQLTQGQKLAAGVYLVTGGLGGLGESLLDYLFQQGITQVILTGREPLASHPQRQSRFNLLQARFPSKTLHYQCLPDWRAQSLESAIGEALTALGAAQLQGIFHLAGAMEMQPIAALDEAHWQRVLGVKVAGGQALANYLSSHSSEGTSDRLLVQYGSVNGYFGGASAMAYSLACGLQNRLAEQLNAQGQLRAWTLNWSLWQGAGMAAGFTQSDVQMARNKGFIPIPESLGPELLQRALATAPGNYVIGLEGDNPAISAQINGYHWARERLTLFIDNSQGAQPETLKAHAESAFCNPAHGINGVQFQVEILSDPLPMDDNGQVSVAALQSALVAQDAGQLPQTATEQQLADIWSDVLGCPVQDVSRTFFEYGGHSINATQVVASINQKLGQQLTVAHLFQYSSIARLAEMIEGDSVDRSGWLALGLGDYLQRTNEYQLLCVNPDSQAQQNVVLLPSALGITSAYGAMLSSLGDYRFWVLGLPLSQEAEVDLALIAQHCADLLSNEGLMQSNTTLLGWSYAGVLGHEMLRLAAATVETLPRLVMLDSGFNEGLHDITREQNFQQLMFASELGLPLEKMPEFNQLDATTTKLHRLQQYLASIDIEVAEASLLHWWQVYEGRLQSLLSYQIPAVVGNTSIVLLKASLHSHGRDDLGWQGHNNNIEFVSIPADHLGVVSHPDTLQWIKKYLTKSS